MRQFFLYTTLGSYRILLEGIESMGEFHTRLTALRVQRGLSKRELADVVGIGPGTISHLEMNRRKPSIELAIRLAKELDVSLDVLMGTDTPTEEERVLA